MTLSSYTWKLIFVFLPGTFLADKVALSQAQRRDVQGSVMDTTNNPIQGASVRLTSVVDTLVTVTDDQGRFVFRQVLAREFRLTFSMLGYRFLDRTYLVGSNQEVMKLIPIVLYPQPTLLETVQINQAIRPYIHMGDTIQYNFEAYNFRKNTLLEGALKMLPNVQVLRDGTVIAHGKRISRVQVDGKNFFGGDVLTATRNLHAELIKSVQVIDFYGDVASATGIKNTEPEKIINIVLHEDKKKIRFGQVTGGGGSKDRYIGSLGINNFNDGQELSLIASTNNTNTSLFSYGSPNGGARDRDAVDLTGMTDPVDGVNKINSLGLSFSDQLTDKIDVYGKYAYTHRKNATLTDQFIQSAFQHYVVENLEKRELVTDQRTHSMSWDLEANTRSNNYFKISPNLSYNTLDNHSASIKTLRNRRVSSEGEYGVDGLTTSPNFSTDMIYVRGFRKDGRKLVVNAELEYARSDRSDRIGDYFVSIDSAFAQPRIDIYSLLQQSDNKNLNRNGKIRGAYVEPVHKKGILEFSFEYNYTSIGSSRQVTDLEALHRIDSLGIDYHYFFQSNRYGLTYQVEQGKKLKYSLGLAAQPLLLEGYTLDRTVRTRHKHFNWVPSANLRYRITDEAEWSVDYLGINNQPSFVQMQPVRDLSNSQNIIIGNADLRAEFVNRISTRFRKTKLSANRFFEGQVAFSNVRNKIVSNRRIIPGTTAIETTFLNTDGYYDVRSYYMYSTLLGAEMLQLNLNGTGDFIHNVSYTNDQRHESRHLLYSQTAQLRYSLEDVIDLELNGNYTLNRSRSSLGATGDIRANSMLVGMACKGYLSDYLAFGFDLSHRSHMGYSSYVNSNPTLLNAYLEYTFMSNRMAMLRLHGFDVFNQNTGITKEVYDNIDLSVRNNRLGRYFMLSLNVRLQKLP